MTSGCFRSCWRADIHFKTGFTCYLHARRRQDAASASPLQGSKLFSHYAEPGQISSSSEMKNYAMNHTPEFIRGSKFSRCSSADTGQRQTRPSYLCGAWRALRSLPALHGPLPGSKLRPLGVSSYCICRKSVHAVQTYGTTTTGDASILLARPPALTASQLGESSSLPLAPNRCDSRSGAPPLSARHADPRTV